MFPSSMQALSSALDMSFQIELTYTCHGITTSLDRLLFYSSYWEL